MVGVVFETPELIEVEDVEGGELVVPDSIFTEEVGVDFGTLELVEVIGVAGALLATSAVVVIFGVVELVEGVEETETALTSTGWVGASFVVETGLRSDGTVFEQAVSVENQMRSTNRIAICCFIEVKLREWISKID